MKREILFAGLLAAAAGCTAGAQDMENTELLQRMAQVNNVPALLAHHDSVEYKAVLYDAEGGEYMGQYLYADADTVARENDDAGVEYCSGGEAFGYREDLGLPFRYLFIEDAYETYFSEMRDISFVEFSEEETVLEKREEDGLLVVETLLPTEFAKTYYEDYEIVQTMTDTDQYITQYKVSPDSLELYEVLGYIRHEDGSTLVVDGSRFAYDVEEYRPDEELLEELDEEPSRTATVITDPGTEQEKTYTSRICKNGLIEVIGSENYRTVYLDEACTRPVWERTGDLHTDAVYYMEKGK